MQVLMMSSPKDQVPNMEPLVKYICQRFLRLFSLRLKMQLCIGCGMLAACYLIVKNILKGEKYNMEI